MDMKASYNYFLSNGGENNLSLKSGESPLLLSNNATNNECLKTE